MSLIHRRYILLLQSSVELKASWCKVTIGEHQSNTSHDL